ncbi:MAG: DNA polymerase III subunit gamma/tau C-terminal domain-containing protein, partial [Pseudomonadota bacterium]
EPPAHVKFLLATTDPKKVPVTVLSRCLQFQLKNLSAQDIAGYLGEVLESESVQFEAQALDVIARCAAGSMRDALSLTDQAIAYGQGGLLAADVIAMLGVVGDGEVENLLQSLAAGSAAQLMDVCAQLAERNADFADVLQGLLEAFHQQAVAVALGEDSSAFSAEELQLYYQIALIGHRDLSNAPDERSGFEMTMLRMLAFAPQADSQVAPRAESVPPVSAPSESTPSESAPPVSVASVQVDAVKVDTVQAGAIPETADTSAAEQSAADVPVKADSAPSQVPVVNAGSERWAEITESLTVGGVTRMIAEHANLLRLDLPDIELLLEAGHDTLLNDAQQQHLGRALSEVFGSEVKLQIHTGTVKEETPAMRKQRLAAERQAEAEQQISQDANVTSLLAEFNGRVEEIRPL